MIRVQTRGSGVPLYDLPTAVARYRHLVTTAIFCLCCAGCTGDDVPDVDIKPNKPDLDKSVTRTKPDAVNPPPPNIRPGNPRVSTAALNRIALPSGNLPSESGFVFNDGLSNQASEDVLRSRNNISNAIDRMARDAAASPEAQDLTQHYRSSLARAIGRDGVLERLSCGLSICIGIVQARSSADHEAWGRRFASDNTSPTYSYAEATENIGIGYENRLIFSTDPAMNSISGR